MNGLLERIGRIRRDDVAVALAVGAIAFSSSYYAELDRDVTSYGNPLAPWGLVVLALAVVPLLWRSSHPILVGLVSCTATTAYYPLNFSDGFVIVAGAIALYTVVEQGYRVRGWLLGLAQFLIIQIWEALALGVPRPEYALGMFSWVLVILIFGEVMRKRREYRDVLRERAEEAERTREEEVRRRASDERLRLAREVHDVVAHNISLINVQAGSALYLIDSEPGRAAEALATIKQTSKETLRELRATLGVLRSVDESAPRSPAPGLSRLAELVERTRSAGVEVTVRSVGEPRRLATGTDSAAYRIVQESLTNAVRHAEPTAVTVELGYEPKGMSIVVGDNGRGAPEDLAPGNGITGMRERAAALGGDLRAAAGRDGGFTVSAWLPECAERTEEA
ncbi:signal transduction histidine kinase [Spinactinospora alkalitolerans]|uniref:histidine kinase n=1 Tax=Spinactinospora alkalitolerans TaxID=687207 RepID=A0A852TW84_9ACTN|nr:sensor histidine kinase [Spinactinospora alkalitolerans]NYE46130.1 signal transduction histidine kinase [Spinactinospora alkalitolerans]